MGYYTFPCILFIFINVAMFIAAMESVTIKRVWIRILLLLLILIPGSYLVWLLWYLLWNFLRKGKLD